MSTLTGYLIKRGSAMVLETGKGKDTGWRLYQVVATYTLAREYDKTQAVVLTKRGKTGDRWAAGYYLNQAGDLFRGESMGSAKHGSRAEADLVEEARQEAENLAEYWGRRDEEAREEDERQMLEEEEMYNS